MPRMGKTEEDWNGLKIGFLKTVQPNRFCKFKNNAQETYFSLILSFTCNFFAYFKFHSGWGRVIGKIKQINCRDTRPFNLKADYLKISSQIGPFTLICAIALTAVGFKNKSHSTSSNYGNQRFDLLHYWKGSCFQQRSIFVQILMN